MVTSPPDVSGIDGPPQPIRRDHRATVTLAFAGDMHFQLHLAALLDHPRGALGPIARTLADADLTMVNLESAITDRGTPEAKELEVPGQRYYFRTSPAALDVLAAAGVDVVTMANNHGADYGPIGLEDTLAAIRTSPIPVVGIGRDRRAAFTPYRVSVRGTDFAFLGADASMREGASSVWAAGPTTPGIAAAHADRPRALLAAVRAASRQADVVVVYLHWGAELQGCPTAAAADHREGPGRSRRRHHRRHPRPRAARVRMARRHLRQLRPGNFLWYHNHQPETGVLRLTDRGRTGGRRLLDPGPDPDLMAARVPLRGGDRAAAIADWRATARLHRPRLPAADGAPLPAYASSVGRIGPELRHRMRFSHRPGCPVAAERPALPAHELRRFRRRRAHRRDGRPQGLRAQVATVFERLYDARWPIRRMRLVDDYGGDDDRSMAANNTSGFNCRRVAGSRSWSAPRLWRRHRHQPRPEPLPDRHLGRPPRGTSVRNRRPVSRAHAPAGRDHGQRAGGAGLRPDRLGVGRHLVAGEGLPALLGATPVKGAVTSHRNLACTRRARRATDSLM